MDDMERNDQLDFEEDEEDNLIVGDNNPDIPGSEIVDNHGQDETGTYMDWKEEPRQIKQAIFSPKRTPGSQILSGSNNVGYLFLKIMEKPIDILIRETNIQGDIRDGQRWKELSMSQFYDFLAILFSMGLVQKPEVKYVQKYFQFNRLYFPFLVCTEECSIGNGAMHSTYSIGCPKSGDRRNLFLK